MVLLPALALIATLGDSVHQAKMITPPPPPVKFSGDVGYVATSGNSSVQTLNLGDNVSARFGHLLLTQQFAVIHGRSEGATVASSWRTQFRADVAMSQSVGLYASVTYERNIFAGLESRVGTVTGLSAQVLKTKTDKLVVEGGISLTDQAGTVASPVNSDFLGGRAATAFTHQLSPRASIAQSIELLPDFRESADLRVNTETDLLAPFTHRAAVKLSYVIHYDGVPEPGYETTDRLFTSGIQLTL